MSTPNPSPMNPFLISLWTPRNLFTPLRMRYPSYPPCPRPLCARLNSRRHSVSPLVIISPPTSAYTPWQLLHLVLHHSFQR
ncbi:hypothetical protein CVT24_011527 [Panaeolus cyanescens]|uniref:Uncharacterized protein n=1 Tax=Panaeolus cyanescens TaxID=181874 RepID=A0A409YV12_9AGAR|nr:hypothetical protein CVT24_011527 [Panaeolus cyanescens]